MEIINLLEFLNSVTELYTLEYAIRPKSLINLLEIIKDEEQLIKKIDLGIMYVKEKNTGKFILVDGVNRVLSLSLFLHAICECYKKTSEKNDKAIKTIRKKYLVNGSKTKLRLNEQDQIIYDKIIFGERLSGKEKESPLFVLLHNLWVHIKEEGLQASKLFIMLDRLIIILVESSGVELRELYYSLNKNNPDLNQLSLIHDYLKTLDLEEKWNELANIFANKQNDIILFFKDYFITKFSYKEFLPDQLYYIFSNYFDSMLQYLTSEAIMQMIVKSAQYYRQILNVDIQNEKIKKGLIQIKMHNGEDTYAYLLNIYEDFLENNISEVTFCEILSTIDEYLKNRLKNPNNVSFNELIQYLNAFITCK